MSMFSMRTEVIGRFPIQKIENFASLAELEDRLLDMYERYNKELVRGDLVEMRLVKTKYHMIIMGRTRTDERIQVKMEFRSSPERYRS